MLFPFHNITSMYSMDPWENFSGGISNDSGLYGVAGSLYRLIESGTHWSSSWDISSNNPDALFQEMDGRRKETDCFFTYDCIRYIYFAGSHYSGISNCICCLVEMKG